MNRAMPLGDLLDRMSAQTPDPGLPICGLSLDSRQVAPGDLFLAVAGQQSHGLRFAGQAVERGCAAIAWEPVDGLQPPAPSLKTPCVAVPDLGQNASALADRFYRQPSSRLKVIGITGTNGKSTCVELLANALQASGRTCGTIGTLGSGLVGHRRQASTLTTPDAVTFQRELARMADAGAQLVVVEVSSHALDQGRVAAVRFHAAVFTNLSRDHLDYHGTMARYAASKARLFADSGLQFAIINADDEWGPQMRGATADGAQVVTFGLEKGEVRASGVCFDASGTRFSLRCGDQKAQVNSRLLGQFNIANQLAVAAVLHALEWRLEEIARCLAGLAPPPGRMEMLGGGDRVLVVIDYAHTPDALSAALGALRAHNRGRLVCVFGCGGDRDAGKRPMMGAIAEQLADQVVITDDNPRTEDPDRIVSDILSGLEKPEAARVERDRASAIAGAISAADRGDSVLIAGKGHEDYQEIDGRREPFSDRDVAAQALEIAA